MSLQAELFLQMKILTDLGSMKYFEDYTLVVPRIPLARAHHPTRPRFLAENYFFVTESLLGLSPLLSVPPHHEAGLTASHFYPTLIDRCS